MINPRHYTHINTGKGGTGEGGDGGIGGRGGDAIISNRYNISNVYHLYGHAERIDTVGTSSTLIVSVIIRCPVFELQIDLIPFQLRLTISVQAFVSERDNEGCDPSTNQGTK